MAATASNKDKKKSGKNFGQEINRSTGVVTTPAESTKDTSSENQTVHAGGRPSNGPTFRMSLAIPEEYKEGLENAAILHKSNKTAYIISLIRKDLAENGERYAELAGFLKNDKEA